MFVIWGRPNCVWCERSKEFLKERAEPFEYIEVNASQWDLWNFTFPDNPKTVPQILYDGHRVGGYEDLRTLWYSGPREFWFQK